MNGKYLNKYRIPSARLKNWDYGNEGAYFITICTQNRKHYFGEIVETLDSNVSMKSNNNRNATMKSNNNGNATMKLNEMGILANKFWAEIPNHFPFVELGNFVVMPNHIHGILIITDHVETLQCNVSKTDTDTKTIQTLYCNVSTHTKPEIHAKPENHIKNETMAAISPKPGTISTIVRSYKSVVTKHARLIHSDFAWQTRFYDHIIRDSKAFETIQNYIEKNPEKWNEDKFHQ